VLIQDVGRIANPSEQSVFKPEDDAERALNSRSVTLGCDAEMGIWRGEGPIGNPSYGFAGTMRREKNVQQSRQANGEVSQ
jgi:hypothetical protein